jgi:antimicrobial peptide system SdpA family protein
MPRNAVNLPFEHDVNTLLVLPEGWAFFTKNPREARFLVFGQTSDGSWTRSFGESPELSATFGFSRRVRSLNVEAGLILSRVTDGQWRKCSGAPGTCLALWSDKVLAAVNATPEPSLCGPIGVVKQDRVPWAWAKSVNPDAMPSQIVRIDVRCTRT